MRGRSLYPKLAINNLWRNRNTYMPYLLACIVSVFTFFVMLSINTNGSLNGIRGEGIVRSFTAIGTVVLAIFCSILIFYTNSFLIKRRKKELGLYSILGMEKKNIAIVMLFETLFIAIIALAAGLLLGALLSKLLFWILLHMLRQEVMLEMPLSMAAMGISCAFFGAIFLCTLLFNLLQVQIANPINLMAGSKQGEKEPKASWILTVIGIVALAGGYFLALYFKSPTEAVLFFFAAAFLVIIGTYCLFTSGSIAILKLLRKNKKFYYQPNHFISISGLIYRMKQNAAGLATICILSCMVLATVGASVSLNLGAENSLQTQYPYEYRVYLPTKEDAKPITEMAENLAQKNGVSIERFDDYRRMSTLLAEEDGAFTVPDDFSNTSQMTQFRFLLVEDYNRNTGENITLAENEALYAVSGGQYESDSIVIDGREFQLRPASYVGKFGADIEIGRTISLVLANEQIVYTLMGMAESDMSGDFMTRGISFDLVGEDEAKRQFSLDFREYADDAAMQIPIDVSIREESRIDWYAMNGGFLFLGIYFGILFTLAAVLIIY